MARHIRSISNKNHLQSYVRMVVSSILLVVIFTSSGCWFGRYTRYVASRTEGKITNAGQPLRNAKIIRVIVVQHSGEKTIQTAVTDANGVFQLEEYTTRGYVKSIATWVYSFEIQIKTDKVEKTIWRGSKIGNHRFGDYEDAHGFFTKEGDILKFNFDIANP